MASFGEALSKSFVDTFGAMTRASYMNAITNRINAEQENEDAWKETVKGRAAAHGITLPGSQPAAPAPQAPAAPLAAPVEGGADGPLPEARPTATPQPRPTALPQGGDYMRQDAVAVPTQPARPDYTQARTPAGPQAAPRPWDNAPQAPAPLPAAPAPARAPAPPPAAPPPAAPPPAAPAPAPAPPASAMAAAQAPDPAPQPPAAPGTVSPEMPYDERTTAKIIQLVQTAKDPIVTMVAAGAMSPAKPEETQALRAQVPGLVAAVQQSRGGGQGPLTTENWHGFMKDLSLEILKLPPNQQQAAMATLDKVRVRGLGDSLNFAVSAAQIGDLHGATAALNTANSFFIDGHNNKFTVAGDKIRMTRTPEDGKGATVTKDLTAEDVQKYALTMANPTWTMEYYLNRDKFDEDKRHRKVTEAQGAANIGLRGRELEFNQNLRADAAKLKREQDEAARAQTERDAAGVAAYSAAQKANRALANAEEHGATPGTLRNLREAALAADEKWEASLLGMSSRGATTTAALGQSAQANDDRNARAQARAGERQAAAAGRSPLTPDERKALYEQLDSFENDPANIGDDKKPTTSTLWAAAHTMPFAMANRDLPPKVVAGILKRYHEAPNRPAEFPSEIKDTRTGVSLRVPGAIAPQNRRQPGMMPQEGNAPVAQADKPATPGAMQSMVGAAAPPAPPRPDRTPEDQRRVEAGARRAGGDPNTVVSVPSVNSIALRAAVGALSGKPASPGRIAAVARQYGVDLDALNRALGDPSAR